jgi:hypothetical protein
LDKIQPKMLKRDGVMMVVMKVLMMVMMMIPMKSSSMAMTMATISPLREGIYPADFCLPESFLSMSLCVFRPAEAAESISDSPSSLRFSGMTIYARGCWQKWAAPPGGVAPWLLRSLFPSGYFCLPMKYEFLGIF